MEAFHPNPGSTVSLSVTTSSSRVAIGGQPRTGKFQVRLYNAGASTVFINRGSSSVDATTSNMPLPSGAIEVLTFNNRDGNPVTHIAAITASGSATLYATVGEGL